MSSAPLTLVVGAGGLLGRHVVDRLRREGVRALTVVVPWQQPEEAGAALRGGLVAARDEASGLPWDVLWCAGAGVVATPREALEEELGVFEGFLATLGEAVSAGSDVALFLASSAGGVYAGSMHPPFTEQTEPRPLAPYGEVKLEMEAAARTFSESTGAPVLVGRIANLYGPGQNLAKPQGLVSQLCMTHLTGQPLSVYVSMDTRRDYLYVADCARLVVSGMVSLRAQTEAGQRTTVVTKILASGRSMTVGALIGEATRIFRRRPRVVLGAAPAGTPQIVDLRLRSTVWPELDRAVRTPLAVGIAVTAADVAQRRASLR